MCSRLEDTIRNIIQHEIPSLGKQAHKDSKGILIQLIAFAERTWSLERCGAAPREVPMKKVGVWISMVWLESVSDRLVKHSRPTRGPNCGTGSSVKVSLGTRVATDLAPCGWAIRKGQTKQWVISGYPRRSNVHRL